MECCLADVASGLERQLHRRASFPCGHVKRLNQLKRHKAESDLKPMLVPGPAASLHQFFVLLKALGPYIGS